MDTQSPETDLNSSPKHSSLFWGSTFCGLIGAFIPCFVSLIIGFMNTSSKEISLKEQLTQLRSDIKTVNMVDEFAKYAKIQRKINKLSDELKLIDNQQTLERIKLRLIIYVVLYTLMAIMMMYLMWFYRYTPLIHIPTNLFYPFGTILAFPTQIEGSIAVPSWIFITSYVGKRMAKLVQ